MGVASRIAAAAPVSCSIRMITSSRRCTGLSAAKGSACQRAECRLSRDEVIRRDALFPVKAVAYFEEPPSSFIGNEVGRDGVLLRMEGLDLLRKPQQAPSAAACAAGEFLFEMSLASGGDPAENQACPSLAITIWHFAALVSSIRVRLRQTITMLAIEINRRRSRMFHGKHCLHAAVS